MTDFRTKPTLTGDRVILRPVTAADAPALVEMLNDKEGARLTASRITDSSLELAEKWYGSRAGTADRLDLAIVEAATGAFVGEVVLNEYSPENNSVSFRIGMLPAGQNRGLGTEATRLIVGYAFEVLGLHRVSLGVYSFNPRAQRAYEKAGFVREGVLRDALCWEGEYADEIVMAILATDWHAAASPA
ncbi:GNAT family N-acetyltransferase [Longispora albida]|uniref:GNAT family N-acetyltransferase n=1 Tax=Longispora albida TaxID=203523 RepID=UPI0003747C09|nr:GNAT family protein [Longispora albida]